MDIRPKVRNAALAGALAAVTAAWAANEAMTDSYYVPSTPTAAAVTPSEPIAVSESLTPGESVAVPVVERNVAPAITIEERRLTEDQRIQAVVMDRIATMAYISGKIGVESNDSVVTLSGWTSTAGQADRAGRTARGVTGVRYVQNEIRPRIGGSVS